MAKGESATDLRVRRTGTMIGLRTITTSLVMVLTSALLVPSLASAQPGCAQGACMQRPYGDYCRRLRWGRYGARDPVKSADQARQRLEEFYAGADVKVGPIVERELHFEAQIDDSKGALLDRVIIDKRTGRIRSIF